MRSHLVANDSIRSIRLRGDRLMLMLSGALWTVSLGFAPLHNEWTAWAICATSLVILVALLFFLIPGTRGSRIGIGLALMGFPALMVYEAHGALEANFAYFILLVVLLYYRDWRPILGAFSIVTAHHLLFRWLQMRGYPVFVLQQDHELHMVFIHTAYLAVEASVLIFLTLTIRIEALESSAIAAFGERIITTGILDLTFDSERHKGAAARGLTSLLVAFRATTRNATNLATRIDQVSENIATASTRILTMSNTQTDNANHVLQSVQSMSEAGAHIRSDCDAVVQVASHSATIVTEGCATIQRAADLMLIVSQTASGTVTEIDHLQTESARIESIVCIMNDLSNQSSLLALNASIEAARAGEKGKGFQVVAQEIHTLSERSYQSLAEVQSIVDTIGLRVGQLQAHAYRCQSAASEGGDHVKAAHQAFTQVAQHLPQVAQRAGRVVETADQHAALRAEVLSGVSRIGEAILDNATEISSFARLSQSLEEMSEELSANVNQFQHSNQVA